MTLDEFKAEVEKLAHIAPEICAEFKKNLIDSRDMDAIISNNGHIKFTPDNLIELTDGYVSPGLTERLSNLSYEARKELIKACTFRCLYLLSQS